MESQADFVQHSCPYSSPASGYPAVLQAAAQLSAVTPADTVICVDNERAFPLTPSLFNDTVHSLLLMLKLMNLLETTFILVSAGSWLNAGCGGCRCWGRWG